MAKVAVVLFRRALSRRVACINVLSRGFLQSTGFQQRLFDISKAVLRTEVVIASLRHAWRGCYLGEGAFHCIPWGSITNGTCAK